MPPHRRTPPREDRRAALPPEDRPAAARRRHIEKIEGEEGGTHRRRRREGEAARVDPGAELESRPPRRPASPNPNQTSPPALTMATHHRATTTHTCIHSARPHGIALAVPDPAVDAIWDPPISTGGATALRAPTISEIDERVREEANRPWPNSLQPAKPKPFPLSAC
jgi:hypothetical protein